MLKGLFPLDSGLYSIMTFIVDKRHNIIRICESLTLMILVLIYTLQKVTSDSDINGAILLACHNVDTGLWESSMIAHEGKYMSWILGSSPRMTGFLGSSSLGKSFHCVSREKRDPRIQENDTSLKGANRDGFSDLRPSPGMRGTDSISEWHQKTHPPKGVGFFKSELVSLINNSRRIS